MKKQVRSQFIWAFFLGAMGLGAYGQVRIGNAIDGGAGGNPPGWSVDLSSDGDGIADTLAIEGLAKYGNNVVDIYNLSQRLLFSAHYGGACDARDGIYKGRRAPMGTYVCAMDHNEPGPGQEARTIYVNYCSMGFSKIPKNPFGVPTLTGLGTNYWIFRWYDCSSYRINI